MPGEKCNGGGGLGYAEDFDDDALAALAVELGLEDTLPGAEIELAVGDGQCCFVMQKQGFEVGVAIVLAGAVVLVIGPRGGDFLKPFSDVLNEADFEVVDVDGGRDVHGGETKQRPSRTPLR